MTSPSRSDELIGRLLDHNPFTDSRVNAPSDDDVDVADLNRGAFERLTTLAREALTQRRGIGAMLWGEAGVGKSHLLSRLDRWARGDGRACSIYLHNLLASPANLPRVLLRGVVGKLTWTERTSYSGTLLFQLLSTAISRSLEDVNGFRSWSLLRQTLFDVLVGAAPTGPADAGLADPTVIDIFYRFYRSVLRRRLGKEDGATAALAVQWLRGDAVPSEQGFELLGLPPGRDAETPVQIEDAQQIKQVLVCLSRLTAACEQPFILAFDQVDNLEDQQASSLARFLEAVIDSARNMLVITAGIQPSLLGWHEKRIIQDSSWDRIAQVQQQILKLTPGQARQLLEVRLRHFFEPFEDVSDVRQLLFDDSLFPLGTRWFEQHIGERIELRPREILNGAQEAWLREQRWLSQSGGSAWLAGWKQRQNSKDALLPPVSLNEFELNELIDRLIDKRMAEHAAAIRDNLPDRESQAEALAQLLEEQRRLDPNSPLLHVIHPETLETDRVLPYHLLLDHRGASGSELRTGVAFANSASSNSVTSILSRLREDETPPSRLLIVAGADGLALGAKGQEHLEALQSRPGCPVEVLNVPVVELVTLDAMNAVWNLARSEDLELSLGDGRTRQVTAEEVTWSHHRRGRFAKSGLLRAGMTPPATIPASPPAVFHEPEPDFGATIAIEPPPVPLGMPLAPEPYHASIPMGAPVMEVAPAFEGLVLDEEPQIAMPVAEMPVDIPAMAMPVQMELEPEAILFGQQEEPIIAEAAVEEEEGTILLDEEPVVAEEEAAIILSDEPDVAEEGSAIILGEEPVVAEDAAIILSNEPQVAEEEAEAILLNDAVEEEEGTILLDEGQEIVAEEAEAILLDDETPSLDKTQEDPVVLSDEEASAILLDDEQTPKLEL